MDYLPLIVQPGAARPVYRTPAEFFDAAFTAFERARQAAGSVDRCYKVAGSTIRLSFAGSALVARMSPALSHLEANLASDADLTIGLWESDSTGVSAPPPAWDYADFLPNGTIRGFDGEAVRVFFQFGLNAVSALNLERGQGLFWVKAAEQIPIYETGSPLRALFHQWFSRRGLLLAHAGAVGEAEGGVLLAGAGGSGKSNTALSALDAGLRYASDDYCLIHAEAESEPRAYSLYSTGKTHAHDLERLPFLNAAVSNRDTLDTDKALYFLHEHFPGRLIASFPTRAILIPRVTGRPESKLSRASATAGLNALAPSTLQQLPGIGAEDARRLMLLARRVPSYALDLGTDLSQPPRLIRELLAELNPAARPTTAPG